MKVGCPFITCAVKKRGVEFCWKCPERENCKRWREHRERGKSHDSFVCYQRLEDNIALMERQNVFDFVKEQKEREELLAIMLAEFNEGRSKTFYCIAATLLEIREITQAIDQARKDSVGKDIRGRSKTLHLILNEIAEERKIQPQTKKMTGPTRRPGRLRRSGGFFDSSTPSPCRSILFIDEEYVMNYSVDPWIFEKNPDVCFGVVVGSNINNSETRADDLLRLENAEAKMQDYFCNKDIKNDEYIGLYRIALQNVGINPNKYINSVESMTKRISKGNWIPSINALVDLCNAVSIEEVVSLGGHDLKEIKEDLRVRKSAIGDKYLPFGAHEYEAMPEGEVVFTSGNIVQTRQWLWRQSEIGKMTLETNNVFFQLVGFRGRHSDRLLRALEKLSRLVEERFCGHAVKYVVDKENQQIEF